MTNIIHAGMDRSAQPDQPDLTLQLPRDTYWQIVHDLRRSLPPQVSDTPENLAHRDNAAIAQVASLLPGNADEVELAAQCVAAGAHARDCQRLAQEYRGDSMFFLKCHAQATSMLRLAQSARRLLQRVQAERCKREADNVTRDRAAWTEHCAIGLMADALAGEPSAAIAEPPPPPPPAPPAPEPAQDEEPVIDPIAAAEEYALIYPQRASLIRSIGRVPDNVSFGPPDEFLVRALVNGRTPALLALDQQGT